MTFGEKLQKLRKDQKMSQEELASKITVSRQAVSKWELNESMPDTENIIQLSKVLGVSIDYLLNNEIENMEENFVIKEAPKKLKKKYHNLWIIAFVIFTVSAVIIGIKLKAIVTVTLLIIFLGILIAIGLLINYFLGRKVNQDSSDFNS